MGKRPPMELGRGAADTIGFWSGVSRPLARTNRSMAGETADGSEASDDGCPGLATGLAAAGADNVFGAVNAGR
jgi:hypothetical protein